MNICCDIKNGTCRYQQQAPDNAVKSIITSVNNYITQFRRCQEFFSERSELILRG
ncbi:MAG: hypothetical protein K2J32_04920 [Ruminococcus sp.]|nr:hypothetical protein [Ruminococcus sp.]